MHLRARESAVFWQAAYLDNDLKNNRFKIVNLLLTHPEWVLKRLASARMLQRKVGKSS